MLPVILAHQLKVEFTRLQVTAGQLFVHEVDFQRCILRIVSVGEHRSGRRGLAIDADNRSAHGAVGIIRHLHNHLVSGFVIVHTGNLHIGNDFLQGVGVSSLILQLIVQDEASFARTMAQLRNRDQLRAVVQAELEAGGRNQRAAGGIVQPLQHIQHHVAAGGIIAVMEIDVNLPVATLIDIEGVSGVERSNPVNFQLAVHIPVGDGDTEGMQGRIIADAADGLATVGLQHLIGISTGSSEDLLAHGLVEVEGGIALVGRSRSDGHPALLRPFLELELEFGTVPVTGSGIHRLGAIKDDVNGVNSFGNVGVDHFHAGPILGHDDHAVTAFAVFLIGSGKTSAGLRLRDIGRGAFGQVQNLNLLIVLQGHGEAALSIGGHRSLRANGFKGLFRNTHALQPDMDGEAQILRDRVLAAKLVANLFGNQQIAFATQGIDKGCLSHLTFLQCQGERIGDRNVFQRLDFFHNVHHASRQAADVEGLPSSNLHGGFAAGEGNGGGRLLAIGIHQDSRIACIIVGVGDIGNVELERCIGGGKAIGHGLAQSDAGFRLQGQPTIVAQGCTHDEIVAQLTHGMIVGIHEGDVSLRQGIGDVFRLFHGVAVQIHMDITGTDVPGAVSSPLGRGQRGRRYLAVQGLCAVRGIDHIAAVENTLRLGIAHVPCAVGIGVERGIHQIVILIVLSGGIEIGIGVDLAVAGGIVHFILVGIEIDRAIGVGVGGQIRLRHHIHHGELVDLLLQGHFVHQADGILRTGNLHIGHFAVYAQGHFISNHGNQGGRHRKDHALLAGGDVFPNLDGSIHHIRGGHALVLVHLAQIAVGFNNEGRVGSGISGGIGHGLNALMPEAQELTGGIGIPADVIGVVRVAVVAELAILVSQADQRPCRVGGFQAQTGLYRPDHLIAQGGGVLISTQVTAAGDEVPGKLCAGIQGIVNQDALDIRHFHILANLIHEGDIAGQIRITGYQRRRVFGHQANLVDDVAERIRQLVRRGGGEGLVHIVAQVDTGGERCAVGRGLGDGVGFLHRGRTPAIGRIVNGDVHLAITEQFFPIAVDGGRRMVLGVHHRKADGIAQTQGVEQRIRFRIVVIHHFSDVGRRQLGHKVRFVGGADTDGVVAHAGCNLFRIVMGSSGGFAIGHENHNGNAGGTGLVIRSSRNRGICRQQLLHGIQQAQLSIGAGHIGKGSGGLGHGLAGRVLHAGIDRHSPNLSAGNGGFQIIGGSAVTVQGQQHHTVVRIGLVSVNAAVVDHNAYPVVFVEGLQLFDRAVHCSQHGLDGFGISGAATIHGAGQIQNHHGVRGHIGHTGHTHVGCHGRQCHQEAVLFVFRDAGSVKCGGIREHGLIRPHSTGVVGGQQVGQEQVAPAIHG